MDDASIDLQRAARDAAYSMPLEEINPGDPELFRTDTMWPYFERLRKEDPVHWSVSPYEDVGGYWSVTKYNDIMEVETNHQVFSSDSSLGGITIRDSKVYLAMSTEVRTAVYPFCGSNRCQ